MTRGRACVGKQGAGDGMAQAAQRRGSTSSTLSTGEFTLCARFGAYGRGVSGVVEQRAAVFSSRPQAVEVFQAGAWWPGELLGWRHDESGACQVEVRVVLDGRAESAWMDLSDLRLPERRLSVAPGPTLPVDAEPALSSPGGAVLRDVSAPVDLSETVSLPMICERSPNHPAGGRRRAAETGDLPELDRATAASGTAATTAPAASTGAASPARGRHRAPVDPGRHRRADTGFLTVVPGDEHLAAPSRPATGRADRTESISPVRRRETWTAPDGEAESLTRPMRLSDYEANSRRPRVTGSVAGA